MTNKDLILQYVSTGAILTKYQVNKLSGSIMNSYLRRRLQQEPQSENYKLRDYELMKLPSDEIKKYLSNYKFRNPENAQYLLFNSDNPEEIVNLIYANGINLFKTILDTNNQYTLESLIQKSIKPIKVLDIMANKLGVSIQDIMDKINMGNISRVILRSANKEEMTELFLKYKATDVSPMALYNILVDSFNPIEIINVVGKEKLLSAIDNSLDSDNKIAGMLYKSQRPYDLAKGIGFDLVKPALEKLSNKQRKILLESMNTIYMKRLFRELEISIED